MTDVRVVLVPDGLDGERVDAAVARMLGLSRSKVEDLIAAAINDARAKADVAAAEEMQKMQGTLPLPPGFKLPF